MRPLGYLFSLEMANTFLKINQIICASKKGGGGGGGDFKYESSQKNCVWFYVAQFCWELQKKKILFSFCVCVSI
jgi:hypothetical protein